MSESGCCLWPILTVVKCRTQIARLLPWIAAYPIAFLGVATVLVNADRPPHVDVLRDVAPPPQVRLLPVSVLVYSPALANPCIYERPRKNGSWRTTSKKRSNLCPWEIAIPGAGGGWRFPPHAEL